MTDIKPKILIVEDDLDVAEMLNAYFRVQGYEVFTVNWGEDGVRSSQTVHPDLVILDIRLPDIDGYEVARRLRGDRRTSDIPIIFLTEKRDRSDRLQGLELGERRVAMQLAGVVRLANALDPRNGTAPKLVVEARDRSVVLQAAGYAPLERSAENVAAARHLLETVLRMPVIVKPLRVANPQRRPAVR